jgi:hypothetical protein
MPNLTANCLCDLLITNHSETSPSLSSCPNSKRCPVYGKGATCTPHVAKCRTQGHPHCFGWLTCPGGTCPEWEGFICVYDGTSNNWKVCADSSCPYTPSLPRTALDHCDPTLQAIEAGNPVDDRTSTYCEYKNWRAAPNALTGHLGRCTSSDPADCHGNCNTKTG